MNAQGLQINRIRVLVVGLGLIGGSFAAALKEKGICHEVAGYDRSRESVEIAFENGLIDRRCYDLRDGIACADVVMLAVPMLAMPAVLQQLVDVPLAGKVVTDVGSCKGSLVESARQLFGEVPASLVPGHPIAGSEKSGVTAARSDLFNGHKVILTPLPHTDIHAMALIKALWQACGAHVDSMEVEHHDEVLALTSHLPHFLAFSLVDTLAGNRENQDIFRLCGRRFSGLYPDCRQ